MKSILIPFGVVLLVCSACDHHVDSVTNKQASHTTQQMTSSANQHESNNDALYSYQQYKELFNKSSTELRFPDAHLVDRTKDTNLVAIDAADSFHTRSFLTLHGDQSNDTTQKQLIYEDTGGDAFTIIDVIYLKHSLGKDIISWPSKALATAQKEQILKQYDTCSIAYDNILVQITRISKKSPLQLEQMQTKINAVTSYLQKELG